MNSKQASRWETRSAPFSRRNDAIPTASKTRGRPAASNAAEGTIAGGEAADAVLRSALEAAPAGMVLVDSKGLIALANSRSEALFGYGPGELIGRPAESLLQRRFREGLRGRLADFLARNESGASVPARAVWALREDGAAFPVEIVLNLLATSAGRFALVAIVDLAPRLALEKRLAASERLADIGGMVSVVAHEIRNPLSTIVMAAKAAAHDDLTREEHAQVLSLLTLETERLDRTLTDILRFAKPCLPQLIPGNLNGTAREVLAAVKSDPNNAGKAEVREDLDEDLPEVLFDGDQMRQVLWNVISNAFQALDGSGRVEVSTEARAGEVAIHVQDDGPGIPRENLEKIFQPFFTTKSSGTGLGLPTSRRIVRAHGGDIRVESAPGRGSRFSIVLPALAGTAA
jgi:PAS domain S-box-containing protein